MSAADTIFALASGAGRAAIAVIRLSGTESGRVLGALAGDLPPARRAALRTLRRNEGELLDRAIVLWLPASGSYTGEDSAELHVHGGPAVVRSVSAALVEAGARPAMPGEFTRRAFLNGRMGLLEAEAVHDLVTAETEGQRRQALRQLEGEASRQLGAWREQLQSLLAWQEALIDFPEEGLPAGVEAELETGIERLREAVEEGINQARAGAKLRDGLVFAVIGAPNVGKSSLVNALAGREAAIVSEVPGTTRDTVEVTLELAGVPVTLVDTAGLRETADPIEREGVRRARLRASTADLILRVVDRPEPALGVGLGELLVVNKIDQWPGQRIGVETGVSALTGDGVGALRALLTAHALRLVGGGSAILSRARHEAALRETRDWLAQAARESLPELRGEALRLANQTLGRITAPVEIDDLLDRIFGEFCIGK